MVGPNGLLLLWRKKNIFHVDLIVGPFCFTVVKTFENMEFSL